MEARSARQEALSLLHVHGPRRGQPPRPRERERPDQECRRLIVASGARRPLAAGGVSDGCPIAQRAAGRDGRSQARCEARRNARTHTIRFAKRKARSCRALGYFKLLERGRRSAEVRSTNHRRIQALPVRAHEAVLAIVPGQRHAIEFLIPESDVGASAATRCQSRVVLHPLDIAWKLRA